jgi:hypothetical protein
MAAPAPHALAHPASEVQATAFSSMLRSLSTALHKSFPSAPIRHTALDGQQTEAILARHTAAQKELAAAQEQLKAAELHLQQIHVDAVALHTRAVAMDLNRFVPGHWIVLGADRPPQEQRQYGRIIRADPKDGQVKVEWLRADNPNPLGPSHQEGISERGEWIRPNQVAQFTCVETDELRAGLAAAQADATAALKARQEAENAAGHPPHDCPTCGHKMCGKYHYVDPSAMSGWVSRTSIEE